MSSIGPGATNMITGAAQATVNRLPVLLFPSDYFANRLPDPVLQQVEHPIEHDVSASDAFRPVSRYFDRISRPEQLLSSLPEAFRVLTDPAETGAVTITLPEDVQAEVYDWPERFFERRVWHVRRPLPERGPLAEVAALVRDAKKPLIVAGGGAIYSGAEAALDAFATTFGIPVSESQAGKGVLPWNHPMNVGPVGANGGLAANRLAKEADLVIHIGSRMGDFVTASKSIFQNPDAAFVGINVNGFDAHKLRAVPLVADAREALIALTAALADHPGTEQAYRDRIGDLKEEWDARVVYHRTPNGETADLAQPEVIGIVNDVVGGHATVVCAAGSLPGDLLKLWRPEDSKAYHLEYGYSCMGYEIPAGIGVKMAEPGARGRGRHRRRDLPDAQLGDRHGGRRGHQDHGGRVRQPRLPVHQGPRRERRRAAVRQRAPLPRGGHRTPDRRLHAGGLRQARRGDGRDRRHRPHGAGDPRRARAARTADRTTVIHVYVSPDKRAPGYEGWWDVPPAEVSGSDAVVAARARYEQAVGLQREELA